MADRLLASPRYGERWAQHWLDVVRFAETEGFEYDRHIPDAWRFRDYVIDSLNRDKPFNRFLAEQIAGDEIAPDDPECLTASAFHRLGPVRRNAGNPDIALSRNEVLTERTDIIGTAFLGLTIGCARCHNHKLEPISQKDYYRFQAYLAATDEHDVSLAPEKERTAWEAETKSIKDRMERVRAQMKRARGPDRERLAKELEALEDQLPAPLATIPATRNDLRAPDRRPRPEARRVGGQGRARRPAAAERTRRRRSARVARRRGRPAHPAGRVADRPVASADGPGLRQPRLATSFRHRAGQDGQRLRHQGRPPQPSRAARLAGLVVHLRRLAA